MVGLALTALAIASVAWLLRYLKLERGAEAAAKITFMVFMIIALVTFLLIAIGIAIAV